MYTVLYEIIQLLVSTGHYFINGFSSTVHVHFSMRNIISALLKAIRGLLFPLGKMKPVLTVYTHASCRCAGTTSNLLILVNF